ncbi:MAG TPA: alginate lyase family protein [Nitrospira sp.]|nr:alginate lyase family protein [Nitrospira sp.]HNA27247.1 alginate lyase family protein [Nitrospira sp.]HNG53374.1 alginate lyase family protein [Nitrospira sp.]HNI20239.1 alginate lyase family protein [Nitrospira sp.]
MTKWKWMLNRLQTMSAQEMAWRGWQAVTRKAFVMGIGRADDPPEPDEGRCGAGFLSVDALDRIDRRPIVEKADAILAGRWDIFALQDVQLGFPPRWNVDPLSATQAPLVCGKAIDFRQRELVGNIKYLWEPSRHLELVTLAQAWLLSRDDRYLNGVRTLLDSWLDECPYPTGVHWASSLELAIRLVNWACCWQLVGGASSRLFEGSSGAAFRKRWLRSIYQHCHFVRNDLSLHSSANNHLFGEYMGLFVASLMWPCWEDSRAWFDFSMRGLEEEAVRQISMDGVHREQAIYYQHEVMSMMLISIRSAAASGVQLSDGFLARLERMAEFVASLMDVGGNVPMIGDADGAQMIRLEQDREHDVYRSLLVGCAILFGRADFKRFARQLDDCNRWYFGATGDAVWNDLDACSAETGPALFPDGGYFFFGKDFGEGSEIKGIVDCGPIGYPSIAAHGHADALSIMLSIAGQPCLIDPGTYSYWADEVWRSYFRGTSAHNTIRIDEVDQSESGGRFMWLRKARVRVHEVAKVGDAFRFVGAHDGYERLDDPVRHTRVVEFDAVSSSMTVVDELTGMSSHIIEQFWHFAPGIEVSVRNGVVLARGQRFLVKAVFDTVTVSLDVWRGSEDPLLGWYSDAYERKMPCTTLRSRVTAAATRLKVVFSIELYV